MKTKGFFRLFKFVASMAALSLAVAACGEQPPAAGPATSTPAPATITLTAAPTSTPTKTPKPTATPRPTSTPNLAETQRADEALARVASYAERGYLSSTQGQLYRLTDFQREMAKINFLDYGLAGYNGLVQNFAVWGDIKMQSARPVAYPEYSGCGFSFRINPDNYDGYTAHITNERVLVTFCNQSIRKCGFLGKSRGTGKLNLPNPAEASMELIVNGTQAYVKVNGEFIAEYSLFTEKMLDPGYLLYSIISGTNAEYGTRCEITNANLWVPK